MNKFTEQELLKMKDLYENQGLSTSKIGDLFGVSRTVVGYNLRKLGVQLKPRGKKFNINNILSKINSREFDYFIGIFATDGNICNDVIQLELSEENKEILDYWNEFVGNTLNVNIHTNSKGIDYYKISFMDKEFSKLLNSYGITPRKSYTLKIKYITWDVLRGIFDGDGSLSLDFRHGISGKFRIASGSIQFLN